MVEPLDTEMIGHGVGAHEVGEAHQLEPAPLSLAFPISLAKKAVARWSKASVDLWCKSIIGMKESREGRELLGTCYHWTGLACLMFQ